MQRLSKESRNADVSDCFAGPRRRVSIPLHAATQVPYEQRRLIRRAASGLRAAGCASFLVLIGGCAAHHAAALPPLTASTGAGTAPPSAAPEPAAPNASTPPVAPATPTAVETWDKQLAAALAALEAGESVDKVRRVAIEYARLGVYDQAENYLSRALKLDPRDAASWEARAQAWRDMSLPERALPDAQRAIFFAPKSASARNTLGTILYALNMPADAAQAFSEAVAIDPTASWARSNLCYVSLLAGDAAVAIQHCSAAIAADPRLSVARNNLALVHAAEGRMDDARREFMAAGSKAEGHYNTGIVLMARKEYSQAVTEFEAAGRADPKLEPAFTRAREARLLAARAAGGK